MSSSALGRVRMRSPFAAPDIRASEKLAEKLTDDRPKLRSGASTSPGNNKQDNFNFQKVGDILPRDEDYIS
jgi:hypothetical protein